MQHGDSLRYFSVIEIFYCANTIAFHMTNSKFRKGVNRLNLVANELLLEKDGTPLVRVSFRV